MGDLNLKRNVIGQQRGVGLVNRTDGTDVSTGTAVCRIKKGTGTWGAITGTITHSGEGNLWTIAFSQADTDAEFAQLSITHPDAISVTMNFTTDVTAEQVTGDVGGNVVGSVGSVSGNVDGNVTGSVGSVAGNVDGNVTGSVGSVVADVSTSSASNDAAANALLDLANGVETGYTVRQVLRLNGASAAAALSGAATSSVVIRNLGNTLDRITMAVDANGNRSSPTYNLG